MNRNTALAQAYNNRLFVVDKSVGPTSFDVVSAFRKATKIRKVGHTGTLDPMAEGVLLICSGVATRAVEHFMNLEKEYRFVVHLGVETTTLDAEGDVVREAPCPNLDDEELARAAFSFVGDYEFDPPAFSALKKNGQRLYSIARSGETPVAERRRVRIYQLDVVAVDLPMLTCVVRCSRGTYVRSLARDLGALLGVPAHVARLERTRIGPFGRENAFPSDKLVARDVAGMKGYALGEALDFLPGVVLEEKARKALKYGTLPETRDVVKTFGELTSNGPIRILDDSGALLAVGERNTDKIRNALQLVDSYRLYVDLESAKTERKPGGFGSC